MIHRSFPSDVRGGCNRMEGRESAGRRYTLRGSLNSVGGAGVGLTEARSDGMGALGGSKVPNDDAVSRTESASRLRPSRHGVGVLEGVVRE